MKHIHDPARGFIGGLLGSEGCSDLLKPALVKPAPASQGAPEAGAPPLAEPGMGRLTITLTGTGTDGDDGGGERTLVPNAPGSFSKYELVFTPKSGQEGIAPVMFTEGTSLSLTLPVGDWNITALAYIQVQGVEGIADGDYAAARGSIIDVAVSSNWTPFEFIDLRGNVEQGKGVFSYDIAVPRGLDSASLEMLGLAGGTWGTPVKSADLKTASSGSFVLDSGYYLLKISRVKGGNTTVRAEVVHIYTDLTTEAGGPGYDFTGFSSAAEVLGFLSAQPVNTAGSPYTVVLGELDLGQDLRKGGDPLGLLFEALEGKYVSLDLSACVGNLPVLDWETAVNRPDRDKVVSLVLPDGLTSIGGYAFESCTSLAAIDLPDSLISIGEYAFFGCTSLAAIDLPDGLTSIGDSVFFCCTSLASIDLPDGLTSIGGGAFSGCGSLAAVDLPDSLISIGWDAFWDCTSLRAIDLPDSLTSIERAAFRGCTSLASINLPDFLTSIGNATFEGCTSLAAIDLPDSLTSIGYRAFFGCTSLTAIDLPDSLASIGWRAFGGCTSLAAVISRNTTPPELEYDYYAPFSNTSSSLLIYVPDTSVAAYKSAIAWSYYASQIKPLSELP